MILIILCILSLPTISKAASKGSSITNLANALISVIIAPNPFHMRHWQLEPYTYTHSEAFALEL